MKVGTPTVQLAKQIIPDQQMNGNLGTIAASAVVGVSVFFYLMQRFRLQMQV